MSGLLLGTAEAHAVVCNQSPTGNTVLLGCTRQQTACVVGERAIEGDCVLDYEGRPVTFRGAFEFGSGRVEVQAGSVTVEGTMFGRALDGRRRGGRLTLTATTGAILVQNKIDVTGNGGGAIALRALQGSVTVSHTLTANGRDEESPNAADGGTIDVEAAGAIALEGEVAVMGGADGGGGSVTVEAGGNIAVSARIDATGGSTDGGEVTLTAGDDVTTTRALDVGSTTLGGSGGTIALQAGLDVLGGTRAGGSLNVQANLSGHGSSEGSGEDAFGGDGADVTLAATGPVTVSARIEANGAAPDGAGGSLEIESTDADPLRLTARDGDLALEGAVSLRGASQAQGGTVTLRAGRDLLVTGAGVDLSGGETGGEFGALAGRHAALGATVDATARRSEGDGGSVDVRAGLEALGTLSLAAHVDAGGPNDGRGGSLTFAGCRLTATSTVTASAEPGVSAGASRIDLAAVHELSLVGGRYLAAPNGAIVLTRPPAVLPTITDVEFAPPPSDIAAAASSLFPACPDCGDGIRQPGEVCDPGAGADGACCNATCTALVCATPTRTPTPTMTPVPTRTATPTVTFVGPTGTPGPDATVTSSPATPGTTPTASGTAVAPTPSTTRAPVSTESPSPTPSPLGTGTPVPTPTAVLDAGARDDVIDCQRTLTRTTSALAMVDLSVWQACAVDAFACVQRAPRDGARGSCIARARRRCERRLARIDRVRDAFSAGFSPCTAVPLPTLLAADGLGFAALDATCRNEIGLGLTSPEAIAACIGLSTACSAESTLAASVPRSGDLLRLLADADALGLCITPPTGEIGALNGEVASAARRCQRSLAGQGRHVFARTLRVLRSCADAGFRCRLGGESVDACAASAQRCARRLASLPALRVRALARAERLCARLDDVSLRTASGLGLGTTGPFCLTAPGPHEALRCVVDHHACAAVAAVRRALPGLDDELARYGLAVDDACPN